MKITVHELPRMTVEEFADLHDLEMEVRERFSEDGPYRFYAHFSETEESRGGLLVGVYGDGGSPEEAIANYAKAISGKLLVVQPFSPEGRKKISVPILIQSEAKR